MIVWSAMYWYSGFWHPRRIWLSKIRSHHSRADMAAKKRSILRQPAGTAIAKATKNPDAAWKALRVLQRRRPALARAKSAGVPALRSLYPLMRGKAVPQQVQRSARRAAILGCAARCQPVLQDSVFNDSWLSNLEPALRGSISFEQLVIASNTMSMPQSPKKSR